MTEQPAVSDEPLVRQLSALGIWLLAVNGMIGAGIFGLPAEAARLTGVYSPLLFLLCGAFMAPVMLSFGEVASYFRGTGGPILYTRTAFGSLAGFQTGWALYVGRLSAVAANINLLVSSVSYFWEPAGSGILRVLLLLLICTGLTWVNIIGTRQAMRSVGILTLLKILPLAVLVGFGAAWLDSAAFSPTGHHMPTHSELGTALLLLIYAYVGWESALIPAGETHDPQRDMPRALVAALIVTTVLYVMVQAVSVAVFPGLAQSSRPLVDAAAVLFGSAGALLLAAGVVASVGGNVASAMFSAPRVTYALARGGALPAWFGAVHSRFLTPHRSVVFFGVVVFVLAVLGSFAWLAGISVLTRILIYILCIGTIPSLRRRFSAVPGHLRLPGGLSIPFAAIGLCLLLLTQVRLAALLVTVLFLAVGTVLYLCGGRGRSGGRA